MRKATHNWIVVGIGLFACLLVISGSILYRDVRSLYENSAWVAHTHAVMTSLEKLMATVVDAETGQRGYIITGREEYLVPYQQALGNYEKDLDEVAELTIDNEEQSARMPQLRALVAERLVEMRRVLELRQKDGFDAASSALNGDLGRRQMKTLRGMIREMLASEELLLADRKEQHNLVFRSALLNAILSTVVGLTALAVLWFIVHRHLQTVERSTAAIHEHRELLKAMLGSIGDGVIATDQVGNVTLLNDVAQKLTGWREQDAIGKPLETVFRIVNEETRLPVDNPAMRALRLGEIVGLANHTILLSKSGVEWPLDDSASPIRTESGQIAGAILVFREITERKQQEKVLLEQANALADADHRKDEFLATLSHELRNPLAPLSNALQLWPFIENDRVEVEKIRALMIRQVRQMARLIDDLLDVSRITSGKIHLQKQPVDVKVVMAEAIEAVKPLMESAGQTLTLALPETPLTVEGDVARLTQVFGNVLNNAAKYTGRGGVIWLTAEGVDGQVVVRVRDNGPGIPASMLNIIFEMFRQGDGSLERAHGGLGIGLTLVKRLVQEHGGTVEARSEGPGRGSEFIITLPRISATLPSPPGNVRYGLQQLAGLPPHRILVVDDIKASAHTLAMMLRAVGQEVAEAHDGPSAIEWVRAHRPDVVFLDIAMPGMSGYDVARTLHQEMPTLVMVALTGYGQEDDRRQALEAGFAQHLIKPVSLEALHRLLLSVGPSQTADP